MVQRSTEARHPASEGLHKAPADAVMSALLEAQTAALHSVRLAFPALEEAGVRAAKALQAGGKLAYVGAGSSGLMALSDCLELAGTFGIPPERTPMLFAGGAAALLHMTGAVEDDPALAQADFIRANLTKGDVALCLSASGTTPYTLEITRLCKEAGVFTVGIANVADAALLRAADLAVLLDTGPEVVSGSTRMGAATAQKLALNMISVQAGLLLGHVHDGYMVNVIADNAKLRDRAARIVAAVSGQSETASRAALEATKGAVKPAILVARGRSTAAAVENLEQSYGHLEPWLKD
ncbi:N-acetylmuramic acid 6-phosphate etherase [Xinfangfangia sp. CPCC 101601]|uniref:N-acetylmuramic acid 6-phosphate etherase n=1 Tax=Pseudogemmobacter lacusdianii TaxID=3069608 RepID=A0ABU0VU71_9RHOB|nr:N-acetylmuramic acid 6-phosphate etherase [Xinfangfangia sp. CPCC 101601]MDQ2065274.1 N-acetylmuramic acid 6-phosphate etherase [Xinfangfangia sp. CPCC 101601]